MSESVTRATALDFATQSVFGGESQKFTADFSSEADAESEVRSTLNELVQSFGAEAVRQGMRNVTSLALPEIGLAEERLLQAIRGYSVIILESKHPKFTAQLVGKIAKMEITTGKRIDLRELGATIGVSKQAASKQLAALAERLGLPRPDSNEKARASHRTMNRRNYGSKPTQAA